MGRSFRATKDGCKEAKKAFKLKGWTQEYLAGVVGCTRQTIIKFFARRPVAKHFFQSICNELSLEWGEIADLELEEEQASRSFGMNTERGNTCEIAQEERSTTKVLTPPVSLAKNQNVYCKEQLVLTFTGNIKDLLENPSYQAAILACLQAVSEDISLTIEKIEEGSIRITFSGSPEGLKRLEGLITSGELTEVEGLPVEKVQLLTGITTEEAQDKIRLVQEIITQGVKSRDLSAADLSGVDLRDTDLSNTDLRWADLRGTDLRNANLEGADLNCADLNGTNLNDANLNRVSLHDAVIDETTRISDKWRLVWKIINQPFKDRDLSGADLSGTNLSGVDLSGTNLSGADLSGADLSGAISSINFSRGADLSHTNLSIDFSNGAYLNIIFSSGANLRNTILSYADLSGAILIGADLSDANLSSAILIGADLSDANLSGAILIGAYLIGADLSDAHLSHANLSHAILIGADLSDAILSHANLSGAILIGADLSSADLSDADLSDANLSSAQLSKKVKGARFVNSREISETTKRELIENGAIFKDSPGDRESRYSPVNR